ncbi:MAG: hypothetical protein V7709_08945, partial [Halioglobus sp.]
MKANLISIVLTLICLSAQPVFSDALMQSQAIKASTIIQYYIDEKGVKVELEIGIESLEGFKNLLPDEIYQQLGYGDAPLDQRLQDFFTNELAIIVDESPLRG